MFNRRFVILPLLICMLLGAGACMGASATAPKLDPMDLKNIMLVKDVKPGMKGYGKTVFRGTKIETFDVEVIGVLPKMNFGKSLVLVKMKGGPITERGANLIQGMSGSPVYINGKLLGAFAYGEAFIKEPIGMVTPIEDMLDAWDPALPTKPSTYYPLTASDLDRPVAMSGRIFNKAAIDNGSGQNFSSDTLVFRPLAMPLVVRGMSPRIMSILSDRLMPLNVVPIAGPGTPADKANLEIELEPGAAVGVSLATGDLDLTGVGTVTYRRGNRILAFGHPMISGPFMNGMGAMDAAMTTAYVHDVFPSVMISSKVASPIKTVGRVFQDRPFSIAGEIGPGPKMIPLTIHVDDKSLGRKRDFSVQVINHPLFTSSLLIGASAEGIFEMRGSPDDATAKVRTEVVAEEIGTIVRENTFFDPVSIDVEATQDLQRILTLLEYNRFYPLRVKKVDLTVEIIPKHPTAQIQRIFVKESKFEPGDTVDVGVVLKPFRSEPVTRMVSIKLPTNVPTGRMPLLVRGMAGGMAMGIQMPQGDQEGGAAAPSPASTIENVQQLIKKFLETEKNNELVAKVVLPKTALMVSGEKLIGLPPTISEAMRSTKATSIGSEHEEVKVVTPTEWVIMGQQQLMITVEKKSKADRQSASSGSSAPPQPSEDESSDSGSSAEEDGSEEEMSVRPAGFLQMDGLAPDMVPFAAGAAVSASASSATRMETSEAASETTDSSSGDKKPAPAKADEKAVGRAPTVWKQTARTEFVLGTLHNTVITTKDALSLTGSLKPFYESPETYVWAMIAADNGSVYAGTGNHGIIYKVDANGKASVFYDTDQLAVHALAKDAGGNLYAGTSPNGVLYKITPGGSAVALLDADEKYITAVKVDSKGNVYAAAGDRCRVYKITPDGKADLVLDSSEAHALSLAVDKDDNAYVGTGQNGIIYRIGANGKSTVLYDAAEASVTGLSVDSKGTLYAVTAPKGIIYKIALDAPAKVAYDRAVQGFMGIAVDNADNVYAATTNYLYKMAKDETVCMVQNDFDLQFLSVTTGDGKVYAGTGNIGSIYAAAAGTALEGTYESPVHDCRLSSKWGMISWTADLPKGTSLTLQTRTGDVGEPDASWSPWSSPYAQSGAPILSPAGRYIQYRATLKTDDPSVSPVVKDVSLVYLTKNQAPKVTLTSPKGGEKWARTKTIKWVGADPDKDSLLYEIFCSNDGGQTWTPISNDVKPVTTEKKPDGTASEEESAPEEESAAPENAAMKVDVTDPEEALAQMAAELEKHPEIPQDVKDKLIAEAPKMLADAKQAAESATRQPEKKPETTPGKSGGNSTKSTSLTWDTSKYPDGTYLVKVVASDRLSNPTDIMTGEAITDPIVLSNKTPRVSAFKKTITVQADRSAKIEGAAYHESMGLAGVQFKVDSADWAAAAANDGIFDSTFETFVITTQPLSVGNHTVEVKVVDQAGNAATSKVTVKVE